MRARIQLGVLALCILTLMSWATVRASLDRSVFDAGNLLQDPWFVATLADAYCGFLLFYAWVFYKEESWLSRALWLVSILLLGNFAMAGYLLWQLRRWPVGAPVEELLVRRTARESWPG